MRPKSFGAWKTVQSCWAVWTIPRGFAYGDLVLRQLTLRSFCRIRLGVTLCHALCLHVLRYTKLHRFILSILLFPPAFLHVVHACQSSHTDLRFVRSVHWTAAFEEAQTCTIQCPPRNLVLFGTQDLHGGEKLILTTFRPASCCYRHELSRNPTISQLSHKAVNASRPRPSLFQPALGDSCSSYPLVCTVISILLARAVSSKVNSVVG